MLNLSCLLNQLLPSCALRCCLLDVENGKWHLSLRPSRLERSLKKLHFFFVWVHITYFSSQPVISGWTLRRPSRLRIQKWCLWTNCSWARWFGVMWSLWASRGSLSGSCPCLGLTGDQYCFETFQHNMLTWKVNFWCCAKLVSVIRQPSGLLSQPTLPLKWTKRLELKKGPTVMSFFFPSSYFQTVTQHHWKGPTSTVL